MNCEGCGKPLGVIEASRWSVCLDCVKARQRVATSGGRCRCGSKKRPGAVRSTSRHGYGGRSWVPCERCLGTIEQLS